MESLLLFFVPFGVGFALGVFLNHPEELSAHRLRNVLFGGWIGWTIFCSALFYLADAKLCPHGGCIGVALGLAWIAAAVLWLAGGVCATVGIYTARHFLRRR